ncbi:hypothetical protein [Arachidicoccus sp.]|uniref:hypothetical protein n=1 Tax=Arachidicoccus sp. TaxID=1872624 RepID=UPI003D1D600E
MDIITTESREKIEAMLSEICKTGVFTKWEPDEHRSSGLQQNKAKNRGEDSQIMTIFSLDFKD